MTIAIAQKGGGAVTEAPLGNVELSAPSIVKVGVGPEEVASYSQAGNDLVIALSNGQTVTIAGFFETGPDGERSELILEDDNGVLWLGQYNSPWSEFNFAEIELGDDVFGLVAPAGGAAETPGWLLAGLALLGIGGIAAA